MTYGTVDEYLEFSGTTITWTLYNSGAWNIGYRGTFTDNGSSFTLTFTEQSTDEGTTWTPYTGTETWDYVISGTTLSVSWDNWANQSDFIKQ